MVTICYENFIWIFRCLSLTLLYLSLHSTFHSTIVKCMIVGIYYYVDRLMKTFVVIFIFFQGGGGTGKSTLCTLFKFISSIILNIVSKSTMCNRFELCTNNLCVQCARGSYFRGKYFEILRFCRTHFIFLLKSFSLFRSYIKDNTCVPRSMQFG